MADKIKPLKFETLTDGSQFDPFPTETNPTEDFIAAKGMAFENSEGTQVYSVSGQMRFKDSEVTTPTSLYDLLNGSATFDLMLTGNDFDVLVSDDGNVLTL
jgi:hypothetical protein